MRVKLTITTAILGLFLSGCGQVAPDVNGKNNISDSSQIAGDTVSIDENNMYGNESTNGLNSSSDGFQSVYFAFGDYSISSSMEANMNTNLSVASASASKIKIEGNCDEFGTDEYNYALGLKRAKAVKESLVARGVASSNMILVSFGESNPACSGTSESCYTQNRRVDLRLVK